MVESRRILAIGAHPDDAEYGCGGYMQLFAERLIIVVNPMGRESEAVAGAKALGAELVMLGEGTERETIGRLDCIIKAYEPNVICTHDRDDYHQDHRSAALCTLSACRDFRGLILGYCSPSSRPYVPNYFVELSESEYITKLNAISEHKSQCEKGYFSKKELNMHFGYWAQAYRGEAEWVEPFCFQRMTVVSN